MPTKIDLPILAEYFPIQTYTPVYGDLIIKSGWLRQYFGFMIQYDTTKSEVSIIMEGMPRLLVTSPTSEHEKKTEKYALSKITNGWPGEWAVLRHDKTKNTSVWFI